MGLSICMEAIADAVCDRCGKTLRYRAPSKKKAIQGLGSTAWRIQRHRGDKPDEAICPDCVMREEEEKAAKKAALADIADRRAAADLEYAAERKAVLNGEEIVPELEQDEPEAAE